MYPAYITKPLLPPLILLLTLLTLLTMITQWHMPMVTNRWLERRRHDTFILLFANVTIWAAVGISFFLQKLNFPAKQQLLSTACHASS